MIIVKVGQDENKFNYRNDNININSIADLNRHKEIVSYYEGTKCKIEYQLNIFHKDTNLHETFETYDNINQALFRMHNLKIIGIETCNIFLIVRNGNNKIIIDDIVTIDFYDTCLNNSIPQLKELWSKEDEQQKEIELYKEFLKVNNASKLFEEFKKNKSEVY